MSAVGQFFQDMIYSIPRIGFMDILDIAVVTFIIYNVLRLVRSSRTGRAAWAIIILLLVTWLTDVLDMYALHWMLSKILEVGAIALIIVFQPELRRLLERFGAKMKLSANGRGFSEYGMQAAISATVMACETMSKQKVGVLLIFERNLSLEEYFKTGTVIDARVTEQLLRNLFFPNASLHDGAVIIRDSRVAAAGCVMPLSDNTQISSDLGTRHRAGIGTSEVSDAVCVIVSEETGTISVAVNGMLKRYLTPRTLEKLLMNELIVSDEKKDEGLFARLKKIIDKRLGNNERQ